MMKTTIQSRLEKLFDASQAERPKRWRAALVATGHAYGEPCRRCGGSGYYGHFGVCFECGAQPGLMYRWRFPKLTLKAEARIRERWGHVKHLLGQGWTFGQIERAAFDIWRWVARPGPATKAEWVKAEGKIVREGLQRKLAAAIGRREAREAREAKERQWRERDAAEGFVAVPVTDDRLDLTGEILMTRDEAGFRASYVTKALIKFAMPGSPGHFFKLWGTLPAALEGAQRGDVVAFTARIKVSDKDPMFGFWSRPTRARKVEA